MACNVEIKARVGDLDSLERRLAPLSDDGPIVLEQEDVFFGCASGRLKLRRFAEGHGELIHYQRPDTAGPRTSTYHRAPVEEPAALRDVLARALGVRAVVRKQRRLYLKGPTRIHLDRVEGLGNFVELEVVLAPDQSAAEGQRIAEELMATLGIRTEDLASVAYVDLLPGAVPGDV